MIWMLYMILMTPAGEHHEWVANYASAEECESARNEFIENVVFKVEDSEMIDAYCLDEVVGITKDSPWNGVSNLLGMKL